MSEESNGWGGARKNSGRDTEVNEPTKRRNVSLDDKTVRLLKVLGEGEISRGIRKAARVTYDLYQKGRLPK